MARNPAVLYDRLIRDARQALGTPSDASTRTRLWTLLKSERLAKTPELEWVLDELAIGASYARNHLLSLGTWPAEVVDEVRHRGLALAVARRLAGAPAEVRTAGLREAASMREDEGTWSQRVARALDRALRDAAAPRAQAVGGWLPPVEAPDRSPGPDGDVWRFPALSPAGREAEELHPALARAILARYAAPGDRIVDLTAGSGTIARVARERGCASWSGDIAPRAPFVHQADATDLRLQDGLSEHVADLVLLHPPTYYAWSLDPPASAVAGREGYAAMIADMTLSAARVLRPGGTLVLIGRPVRRGGEVRTAIGDLQNELEEVGCTLVGYHLGVDEAGREDWHVLVGRTAQHDEDDA
jgi:hypothetical protein